MSTNSDAPSERSLMATVNEEIDRLHAALDLPDSEFFCECGRIGCSERTTLTRAEYASLRDASLPLIVAVHAIGRAPRQDVRAVDPLQTSEDRDAI